MEAIFKSSLTKNSPVMIIESSRNKGPLKANKSIVKNSQRNKYPSYLIIQNSVDMQHKVQWQFSNAPLKLLMCGCLGQKYGLSWLYI
jgi:hypothetical protein